METSESIKNLLFAKLKVQQNMGEVKKDKSNPQTHSTYATLDAINKALIPVANEAGLLVTFMPKTTEQDIGVVLRLDHPESEEFIEYDPYLIPKGGNNNNSRANLVQNQGGLITYARRYLISAVFNISADEDADGNLPAAQNQNNNHPNNRSQYNRKNYQNNGQTGAKMQTTKQRKKLSEHGEMDKAVYEGAKKEIAKAYGYDDKIVESTVLSNSKTIALKKNIDWKTLDSDSRMALMMQVSDRLKKTYEATAKSLETTVDVLIGQAKSNAVESAGSDGAEWGTLSQVKQFSYLISAVHTIQKGISEAKQTKTKQDEQIGQAQQNLWDDPVKKAAEKIAEKTKTEAKTGEA